MKKSLLSDTLNITNLLRRNEADHGCKNACPCLLYTSAFELDTMAVSSTAYSAGRLCFALRHSSPDTSP